jgi:REP element-mobilizing transposase RayT
MPIPPESRLLRTGQYGETSRIYHITVPTVERKRLFTDWASARAVTDAMKQAELENEALSLCWVLMPDHLHWLIELRVEDLSRVVGRMKSRSTLNFNRRIGGRGRLWQKGFHDRALRKADDLKAVARYIVANPVRAGLVSRVGDYALWDAVWL